MQIKKDLVVGMHYTLKSDAGEVIDSSAGRAPLEYIQGSGMIVPGLEKAMDGKSLGDQFSVVVSPAEGYGEYQEDLLQAVPREAFQGVEDIQPGMRFVANGPQGQTMVTVKSVGETEVTVDGNHELAGQNLNFEIEVASVREASAEELANGQPNCQGGCCGGHDHDGDHECCGGHDDGECCGGKGHEDGHECCGGKNH